MTYDFNSRLRPGLALEIMKKEIDRLEPTSCTPNFHSSSDHAAQLLHTERQDLHTCQNAGGAVQCLHTNVGAHLVEALH